MTSFKGYQLAADWSRHGLFTNPGEDVTADIGKKVDVTITWGRNEPRATEEAEVGKLSFGLLNHTRKYSPENAASPLAGKVLTGTTMRYQVNNPADGSITPLFRGPLDEMEIEPGAERLFTGTALDPWGASGGTKLSTPVCQGHRTGWLINYVLNRIGWTGPREIDAGATVVAYWWEEGAGADEAIKKLVQAEGAPAIAFVEAGMFVFRDRHHRLSRTQSTASRGTYTHIVPAGTGPAGDHKILKETFNYNHGLTAIVNSVAFDVEKRVPTGPAEVWRTDDAILLGANEVRQISVTTSEAFINAIAPEQARTYDVEGNPIGDFAVASGTVTTAISRTSGQSLYLTLTAGVGGAYLPTGMILRASALVVTSRVKVTSDDLGSQGTFGQQTWPHELPWANEYDAQAIADRLVAVYAQPRPTVTFEVAGVNAASLTRILSTRISDRIHVRNDDYGIAADFYVEKISHAIRGNGLIHKLTIGAQAVDPVQPTNALTFDVAGKGFDDGRFDAPGVDNPATVFRMDTAGQGFDQGRFGS